MIGRSFRRRGHIAMSERPGGGDGRRAKTGARAPVEGDAGGGGLARLAPALLGLVALHLDRQKLSDMSHLDLSKK